MEQKQIHLIVTYIHPIVNVLGLPRSKTNNECLIIKAHYA